MRPLVYNPSFLPTDERIRQFVVRREELTTILQVLHEDTGPSRQHMLVLGGRGLGKSTLVQRVVAEVERGQLARKWYPVVFPEETYEVADIGEFWLEALHRVADQTDDPRWRALHEELHRERDAKRLEHRARRALTVFAEETGRSLLLVVENLDMLMDQIDDDDAWALRQTLQTDPTFLLLATALRPFDAITQHAKPFYEAFRRIDLPPLTAEEIEELWESATGRWPGLPRARAVRVLTGGNPRMVVLLAQLADGHSLRGILDDLTRLVDAHTDYFKSNIEALEGQMRRVFLALATLWRPATAGEVAEEARLDPNVVSTSLTRLERQGRIEIVGKKGKNRQYQVAERLYNIYYLMRRRGGVDARLRALIEFMVVFYAPEDLGGLIQRLAGEARGTEDDPCLPAIDGLLRAHRGDAAARAAILRSLPGNLLDRVDRREVGLSKRKPTELLALIERRDGAKYLPHAARMLERNLHKESPGYLELAEQLVRSEDLLEVMNGAMWLGVHRPGRASALFDADPNLENLAIASAIIAMVCDRIDEVAAWFERIRSIPDVPNGLVNDLAMYLNPSDEAAGQIWVERLGQTSADTVERIFDRLLVEGATANLERFVRALKERLPDVPWSMAAQVEACLALARRDEAAEAATRLMATQVAPEPAAIVAAQVALALNDPSAGRRILALVDRPSPEARVLDAELSVLLGGVEDAIDTCLAVVAQRASEVAWYILVNFAPAKALSAWAANSLQPAPQVVAFAKASVHATDRRIWEQALRAATEIDLDLPELDVKLIRLYGLSGRPDVALERFKRLVVRSDAGTTGWNAIISLSMAFAAAGAGAGASQALATAGATFRLLIAALDPSAVTDLSAEERAITQDIVARVEALRRRPNVWTEGAPVPTCRGRFPAWATFIPQPTARGRRADEATPSEAGVDE